MIQIKLSEIQAEINRLSTPKGFTTQMAADEWHLSRDAARKRMCDGVRLGLIRYVGDFGVQCMDGRMRPIPHYEVVKKKK